MNSLPGEDLVTDNGTTTDSFLRSLRSSCSVHSPPSSTSLLPPPPSPSQTNSKLATSNPSVASPNLPPSAHALDIADSILGHAILSANATDLLDSSDDEASQSAVDITRPPHTFSKFKKKKPTPASHLAGAKSSTLELRVKGQRHTIRALEKIVGELKKQLTDVKASQRKNSTKSRDGETILRSTLTVKAKQPNEDASYKQLLDKYVKLRATHNATTGSVAQLQQAQGDLKRQVLRSSKIVKDLREYNSRLLEEVEENRRKEREEVLEVEKIRGKVKRKVKKNSDKAGSAQTNAATNAANVSTGDEDMSQVNSREVSRLKSELKEAKEERERVKEEVEGLRTTCDILRHRIT